MASKFVLRSWLPLLLPAVAFAETGTPAATPSVPEILKLPDLTVTSPLDLPPPEHWRHTQMGRFEVLSAISDRETKALLQSLHDLDLALEVVWPALRGRGEHPCTLIIGSSTKELAVFAPAGADRWRGDRGMGSVFLREGDRSAIVLLGGNTLLPVDVTDAAAANAGVATQGVLVSADQQLRHDYTLSLLSAVQPRLPAWVEEGLARLVMGMTISDRRLEFAKLEDPNALTPEQYLAARDRQVAGLVQAGGVDSDLPPAPGDDAQFQAALAHSPLMGFPELFAVNRDSAVARNTVGSAWAKQSAAFVHLCLYGDNRRYQPAFLKFVSRLATQPPSEELFKSCFGLGYAAMGAVLRMYVLDAAYTSLEWNARKGGAGWPKFAAPALRDATQAEVGRIKGEAKLMAGKVEAAGDEFYVAYRRGERDPQLIAAIGVFDAAHGNKLRAGQFLNAAVAADAPSLPVYLALARLRLEAALAHARPDRPLTAVEVDQVAAPLRRAATKGLASPELFDLLADDWSHAADRISHADAVLMIRGAVTYPGRLGLVYRAAVSAHDAGLAAEAGGLVEHGLKFATTDEDRARFAELKAAFAQAAP